MQNNELHYPNVVQAVFSQPWAITAEKYATICELVRFRAEGHRYTAEEIAQRIGAGPRAAGAARNGAIAVMPLYGVMVQRHNLMTETSGGLSTEAFGRAFAMALSDPGISAIVLDIDSPGGHVMGTPELADIVYGARGRKPVMAVANSMAASAAYWVASQADEIAVTPSGEVGSIGIVAAHQDISKAEEQDGVKTTLISAGRKKTLGNPYEPLSEEARADIQGQADKYYDMFVRGIARGRGVTPGTVRAGFGEGGMVMAAEAVKLGMADRVATLDQTIERLIGKRSASGGSKAEQNDDDDMDLRSRRLKMMAGA